MTEPNCICSLCGRTFYRHPEFDELVCPNPKCMSNEIEDIEEYDKSMAEDDWDKWQEDRRLYGN